MSQVIDVLSKIIPPLDFRTTKGLTNEDGSRKKWTYLSEPDAFGVRHLFYMKNNSNGQCNKFDHLTVSPIEDPTQDVPIGEKATEWDTGDPTNIGWKVAFGMGQPRLPRFVEVPDAPFSVTGSGQVVAISGGGVNAPDMATAISTTVTGAPYFWKRTVSRYATDYVLLPKSIITNAAQTSSDAGVEVTFSGPYVYPGKGDLPPGEYWMNEYRWGKQPTMNYYKHMERCIYVTGFGWAEWYPFVNPDGSGEVPDPNFAPSILTRILNVPPPMPVVGYA